MPSASPSPSPSSGLLFVALDLETTGLDPETGCILEIGAVIVDSADLDTELARIDIAVRPASWSVLDASSPIIFDMHSKNGLLSDCARSEIGQGPALDELCSKIEAIPHVGVQILGCSPGGVDVPFLSRALGRRYREIFSHRVVDITSIETALQAIGMPLPPQARTEEHRALSDALWALYRLRGIQRAYKGLFDTLSSANPRALTTMFDDVRAVREACGITMPIVDSAGEPLTVAA